MYLYYCAEEIFQLNQVLHYTFFSKMSLNFQYFSVVVFLLQMTKLKYKTFKKMHFDTVLNNISDDLCHK